MISPHSLYPERHAAFWLSEAGVSNSREKVLQLRQHRFQNQKNAQTLKTHATEKNTEYVLFLLCIPQTIRTFQNQTYQTNVDSHKCWKLSCVPSLHGLWLTIAAECWSWPCLDRCHPTAATCWWVHWRCIRRTSGRAVIRTSFHICSWAQKYKERWPSRSIFQH